MISVLRLGNRRNAPILCHTFLYVGEGIGLGKLRLLLWTNADSVQAII